jgi:hypothetical protein
MHTQPCCLLKLLLEEVRHSLPDDFLCFVSQLLAGQPCALHDSARHAQTRAHVQPHRPQARFVLHLFITCHYLGSLVLLLQYSAPVLFMCARNLLAALSRHIRRVSHRSRAAIVQVFCVARELAWTAVAAAGAGEA